MSYGNVIASSIPKELDPFKKEWGHVFTSPYKDCNSHPTRPTQDLVFSLNRRCYPMNYGGNHATLLLFVISCMRGHRTRRWGPFLSPADAYELVRTLLEFPTIRVNRADSYGVTPLMYACAHGLTDVVTLLLRHPDIDVNKATKRRPMQYRTYTMFPLMGAAVSGDLDILRLLLAHPGIDVNQRDAWRQTALSYVTELSKGTVQLYGPKREYYDDLWRVRKPLQPTQVYAEIVQLLKSAQGITTQVTYIPTGEYAHRHNDYHSSGHEEHLPIMTYDSDDTQYVCGFELLEAITQGDEERVRIYLNHPAIDVNFTVTLQALWDYVCRSMNLPKKDLQYGFGLLQNFKWVSKDSFLSQFVRKWDATCAVAFHGTAADMMQRMKQMTIDQCIREAQEHGGRWLGDTPLIRAYELGHTWIVRALLDHPRIHPNQGWMVPQDPFVEVDPYRGALPSLMTLLTKAILDGDEDLVRRLIAHPRIDLHVPFYRIDGDGDTGPMRILERRTLLDVAERSGNEMILGLVRSVFPAPKEPAPSPKPSIRKENRRLFRSMMKALEQGEIPTVEKAVAILPWKYLTAKGGYKESHVQRMIWKLVTLPHSELLRRLLTQFPKCLNEWDEDDYSPLELAAKNDQPDTVAYLLSFPAIQHKTEIRIAHCNITGKARYTWFEWPPKKKKNPLDKKSTYIIKKPHSFDVTPYCGYLMDKHLVKRNELKTLTELCMFSRTKAGVMLPQLPSDVERFVIARFLIPEIPERTEERVERERKDTAELFLLSEYGTPEEFFRVMNYEHHYTANGIRWARAVRRRVPEVVMDDEEEANEEEAEPLLIVEEEHDVPQAPVAPPEDEWHTIVRWRREDDVVETPPLHDTLRRTVEKGMYEREDGTDQRVDLIIQYGIEYCHVLDTNIVHRMLYVREHEQRVIADRVGTFAHGAIQFDAAYAVDWSKVEEEYVVPLPPLPGRNVVRLMP